MSHPENPSMWLTGRILKWVDGDTVDVEVHDIETHYTVRGRRKRTVTIEEEEETRYRLVVVDTPERGQPGWAEATEFCREVLPRGTWVQILTHWEDGAFGRMLADLLVPGQGSTTISSLLLEKGLAKAWGFPERRGTP